MANASAARSHVERRDARISTKDLLIRAGLEAVLEGGWAATGIDKILLSAGVPKGSFYHYFDSKDAFAYALLDSYQEFFLKRLERCFGPQSGGRARSFTHQLSAFLSEATSGMRRYRWRRGCLVGSLGQELAGLNDELRRRLNSSIRQWEERLAASLRAAQLRNEIPKGADVERLARGFWAAWEGAVLRARLSHTAAPLIEVVEDFDRLVHSRQLRRG